MPESAVRHAFKAHFTYFDKIDIDTLSNEAKHVNANRIICAAREGTAQL